LEFSTNLILLITFEHSSVSIEDDEDMTIGCIVQARMGSTRLPGKVLMEVIEGKPVLYYVINQLKYCKSFEKLIIATTTLPEDDKIVQFCTDNNVNYFRGDSKNVLERHYRCAEKFSLSTIIRMPSDKPLLDPEVVDKVVETFNTNYYDYVTNFLPPTFPSGTEVEVVSFGSLKKSWEKAILPSEKEHVTEYIYNHRDDFRIFNVVNSENLSNFRWAVDRIEDLRLVREIVSRMPKSPILIKDILELFINEPSLVEINKQVDGNEGNIKSKKEDEEFINSKKF
jgi:spore coat polysaccharide biosynthesis protein SpsF